MSNYNLIESLFNEYGNIRDFLGETDTYEMEQIRKDKARITREYNTKHHRRGHQPRIGYWGVSRAWEKVTIRKGFNAGRKVF